MPAGAALRDVEVSQGGRGVAAHERIKRRSEFEDQVLQFLERNPEVLELGVNVQVVRSRRDTLVPCDFTVMQDGEAVAAIECKSHRNKRHRRFLVETLAMASLQTKELQRAIVVVPQTWGTSTEELSLLTQELHLSGVRIAVFGGDEESGDQFRMLETKLGRD